MPPLAIPDIIQMRDAFVEEMKLAAKGQKTSIPFIKQRIAEHPAVAEGETFQVLIIGGSVYKWSLAQRSGSTVSFDDQTQGALPAFNDRTTFLNFILGLISPEVSSVAMNIAYALTPTFRNGLMDGVLLWGSKEHSFTGLIGVDIGKAIEDHAAAAGRTIRVAVANDTICLLLSGRDEYPWNAFACGIAGTGLNFALFSDPVTAVNLQSGEFDKLELTPEATELDSQSQVPGSALLEKETAGAYLFRKYQIGLKQRGIEAPAINSTAELDGIAADESHPGSALAREILEYSAALVAMQASALAEFQGGNLTVRVAGGLFWNGYGYRETAERVVRQLSPQRQIRFVGSELAERVGTAKLVS
ncbi:MAG: hypothetical protein N2691_02155 [Patescibacteria group bacterium]|nr:hypothetical protein [Patescibacteria group bacterium]